MGFLLAIVCGVLTVLVPNPITPILMVVFLLADVKSHPGQF